VEEVHGISNSIPFVADISMERLHQHVNGYITMEWRVRQHASKAVESTASGATEATIATSSSADRMKKKVEQLREDRMKMEGSILDW